MARKKQKFGILRNVGVSVVTAIIAGFILSRAIPHYDKPVSQGSIPGGLYYTKLQSGTILLFDTVSGTIIYTAKNIRQRYPADAPVAYRINTALDYIQKYYLT